MITSKPISKQVEMVSDFTTRVTGFEEEVGKLKHCYDTLQDFRVGLMRALHESDDDALRRLNNRYLNYHEEKLKELLDSLDRQCACLQQFAEEHQEIDDFSARVQPQMTEIEDLLEKANTHNRSAQYEYHVCLESLEESKAKLETAQALITKTKEMISE